LPFAVVASLPALRGMTTSGAEARNSFHS